MLTDTGLSEKHWQIISSIFAQFPEIEEKILFGSRAKGTYKKFSDIDFAVDGKNISYNTVSKLKDAFTESLLPFFVDIVLLSKTSSKELKMHIEQYGRKFA